ncbi:MAG: hypothetical protein LBP59_08190 [Planctomycetaceae bacterium]|jgi:hypothetical protein|nr:hypothetical protein [Planctomycetaceae bacterium]
MTFYGLQLDRRSTRTHWSFPKRRRDILYIHLDRQIAVNTSSGLRSETIYNSKGQVEKSISNIKIKSD